MKTNVSNNIERMNRVNNTDAQEIRIGSKVRHNGSGEVATVTAARKEFIKMEGRFRWLYALDFGKATPWRFGIDLNGGEFLAEALTVVAEPAPSAWMTDYTRADFRKLVSRYEVADEDRDIIGQRFELAGDRLGEVQIFVSDYAGNEGHALYYIWDEWMQEVRANVRPLSYLRDMLTTAKGWQRVA